LNPNNSRYVWGDASLDGRLRVMESTPPMSAQMPPLEMGGRARA